MSFPQMNFYSLTLQSDFILLFAWTLHRTTGSLVPQTGRYDNNKIMVKL